jgi:hypothetical protein
MTEADAAMQHLMTLATRQQDLENEVATLQETLAAKKQELKVLSENDLPEFLSEHDLALDQTYKLPDGRTVTFTKDLYVGIVQKDVEAKRAAFRWLIDNGHTAIIKRTITVSFGMKEFERGQEFLARLRAMFPERRIQVSFGPDESDKALAAKVQELVSAAFPGTTIDEDLTVHGSTLKSFLGKQLAAGTTLPEGFTVYAPTKARIHAE